MKNSNRTRRLWNRKIENFWNKKNEDKNWNFSIIILNKNMMMFIAYRHVKSKNKRTRICVSLSHISLSFKYKLKNFKMFNEQTIKFNKLKIHDFEFIRDHFTNAHVFYQNLTRWKTSSSKNVTLSKNMRATSWISTLLKKTKRKI